MISLAWRMLGRALRGGELGLLCAALVVAVAAVTAVGFFADRLRLALESQAQQLIGGDLVLLGDQPWSAAIAQEAQRRGLSLAETRVFPSMVQVDGRVQLADIKAVSGNYPLRGQLSIADRPGDPGLSVERGPQAGEVWVDERLAAALQIRPGGSLQLGNSRLPVRAILSQEPDRSFNLFSLAPRLLMHIDDLPASGLVQFGSRVTYRLLMTGEASAVAGFRQWLTPQLGRGQRLEDASNARPEVRSALDRGQRFLALATALTVVLSAVAVALAARRYMQRHLDACAVMRCLGTTQSRLLRLHAFQFVGLAGIAIVLGSAFGFAAHFVLIFWLGRVLAIDLPQPGWMPLLQGAGVAAVLLFGFAFPPLLQLSKVPTLRVLRRELGPPSPWLLGGYALGLLLLAGLILLVAGDKRLGMLVVGGFAGALAAFWLLARLLVALLGVVRRVGSFGWRQGVANLARRGSASALQVVALAIGLMALLVLTVTRGQLLEAWQKALPADAPNRFVINIQPDQQTAVARFLEEQGVVAELAPMVRARLTHIAGQPVSAERFPNDERAQRLAEREFNLSWRLAPPPANRLVAGRWFEPADVGQGLASVEEGLAKTLGIRLGDELRFMVAGMEKRVEVTALRKLDWDSMRVNFFVLTPPGVIDDAPASYITSFHLPAGQANVTRSLVAAFPNLTVIDVGAVIGQFQAIIDQLVGAVQFVFLFTLLAGGIVLYAALQSAFDERRYELALMRALGARRRQLQTTIVSELATVGAAAGLIAAAGASLLGKLVAQQVFDIDLPLDPGLLLVAALIGTLLSVAIGWLALRRLLAAPPLLALRASA
ncbi:MAG: ABC transporter permease [Rhodocyclales bacterium GT-UBC]|nr:MAG: ABC transporter permease [Rhodocyclales bacterium GT-UBC]